MKSVRTGSGNDVRGRPEGIAKLRIGIVRKNLEFRNRIERRSENKASIDPVEVIRAIDQKVVGFGTLTVDRIGLSVAQRPARLRQAWRQRHNSRLQQAQLSKVAPIERKVQHFAFRDGLSHARDRRLNQLSVSLHFKLLSLSSDCEVNGDVGGVVYIENNA